MKKIIIASAMILAIFVSCDNKIDLIEEERERCQSEIQYTFSEGQTVLGKTIEIPYTIENLLKALDQLPPETKAAIREEDFAPTHYYVRFHPKNIQELDLLINITPRIILSETPLDREVVMGGTYYHDPSLPEDMPTYQYSTLSIERWNELADTLSVEHEILLRAYMPDYCDEEKETKANHVLEMSAEMEALMRKAYEMTGHEYEAPAATKGSSWHPYGHIKAYDNFAGYVPINKVRVRGTHLLKVKETLTDSSGYFYLDSFNNSVSLKVIWESDAWDIRHGNIGQATYDGPTLNYAAWDLYISSSQTNSVHYAAIHRAAYRNVYGNNRGLMRPQYSRSIKIAYMENGINGGNSGGNFNPVPVGGSLPDIQVAGVDTDGVREVSRVFSSCCHEFGHAAHYTNNNGYHATEQIRESWAVFVQYLLTIQEYTELNCVSSLFQYQNGQLVVDNIYNFQITSNDIHFMTYTPMFVDLYDDYNQREHFNFNPYPNDEISGMSPIMIEQFAYDSSDIGELESLLWAYADAHPNNVYNLTRQTVEDLLEEYYWYVYFE